MKVQNLIYGTLFLACSTQASLADNRIDQQLPGAPELGRIWGVFRRSSDDRNHKL